MGDILLELRNISKSFPGVKALDNVSFSLKQGSVHGLIGENGAGKSTLMKILYGIYTPDEGSIIYKNKEIHIKNPADAISKGIAMIPQEIDPVRNLTVKKNIFLGRELRKGIFLDEGNMRREAKELLSIFDMDIDPETPMNEISIGQAQLISIITAASWNCKVIVMDEPTSALTDKEISYLYTMVRRLQKEGYSIVYISHKLQELYDLCDTITVLRDGKTIDSRPTEKITREELIKLMVGRDVEEFYARRTHTVGEEIFKVDKMSAPGFKDVSFSLKRGEILGFYGLIGAGRSEIMETIFGYRHKTAGSMMLNGKEIDIKTPIDAIEHKFAFVTEDRKATGLFLGLTIKNNMIMPKIDPMISFGLVNERKTKDITNRYVKDLHVKAYSGEQHVRELSGGNQQKVLLARWLMTKPDIVILDEPTRGIDVGAKGEIHHIISELAGSGKSVMVVSSEIPEILSIADRIIIMHEGRQVGELSAAEASSEKIMQIILDHRKVS
ncbi:MAG: sugar ABC transporter ATP-binding protein [Brevinema sp.]